MDVRVSGWRGDECSGRDIWNGVLVGPGRGVLMMDVRMVDVAANVVVEMFEIEY